MILIFSSTKLFAGNQFEDYTVKTHFFTLLLNVNKTIKLFDKSYIQTKFWSLQSNKLLLFL